MEEPAVEMAMVGVEGDHRKEEGKEVLPAGEGMEPVEVFFFIVWVVLLQINQTRGVVQEIS